MQVTVVEMEPRLGGVCLLRGCIPSKALLHVAKVIGESHEMADWGVDFAKPKIKIDALRVRKEKIIATLTGGLGQLAKRRKVDVIQARGWFQNSTTLRLELTGEPGKTAELTFDHCILATGSRPVKIPIFDLKSPRVMDSTVRSTCPIFPNRCSWSAADISAWKWAPSMRNLAATSQSSS